MYSEQHSRRAQRRKAANGRGAGHKSQGHHSRRADSHLEQPLPCQEGAQPCPRCGFPVEPKRLHFHMVRVHGETLRHKGG